MRSDAILQLASRASRRRREGLQYLLMLAPYLVGLSDLVVLPAGVGFGIAFVGYSPSVPTRFAGLANFGELLSDDIFWITVGNSLLYIALAVPLRPGTAILLLWPRRDTHLDRAIVSLPILVRSQDLSCRVSAGTTMRESVTHSIHGGPTEAHARGAHQRRLKQVANSNGPGDRRLTGGRARLCLTPVFRTGRSTAPISRRDHGCHEFRVWHPSAPARQDRLPVDIESGGQVLRSAFGRDPSHATRITPSQVRDRLWL